VRSHQTPDAETPGEQRLRLHRLLDEILEEREAVFGLQISETMNALMGKRASAYSPQADASKLLDKTVALARDALGNVRSCALPSFSDDIEHCRTVLWLWIWAVRPLFPDGSSGMFGNGRITLTHVLDELENLNWDQGTFFRAPKPKPGQKANRGKIAKLRLKALGWKKFMRREGISAAEANQRLNEAFGAQWEAMLKWKAECVEVLGQMRVTIALHNAEAGIPPTFALLYDWKQMLERDGAAYKSAIRGN
jgi:hypothetical protein